MLYFMGCNLIPNTDNIRADLYILLKPQSQLGYLELDMPNINSGSTAQQMYDACNEVVKDNFSLSWDNGVSNSSDNTNSMVGAHESLVKKIMYDACNEVVKDNFSLSWDNGVSNSSDNTNSMVGAHESLLKKIKDSQGNQ